MVFSYKSGRFARSLAIHCTRPALNSRVSINNTHMLTHTVRSFWSLLIITTSVCPIIRPRVQKWATSCCSKLHLDTTRTDISQFLDIATIITCTTIEAAKEKAFVRIDCADVRMCIVILLTQSNQVVSWLGSILCQRLSCTVGPTIHIYGVRVGKGSSSSI